MKTQIQFETWFKEVAIPNNDSGILYYKGVAEAAWNAALASADAEQENDRKRIGVEVLERALREAQFIAATVGCDQKAVHKQAIEKLIQEFRG